MSAQEPAVLPASTSAGGAAAGASAASAASPSAAAPSAASSSPGCFSLFVSSLREKIVALKEKKNASSSSPSSSSSLLKPPADWKPKKIAAANPPSRDIVLSVVPTKSKKKKNKKTNGDDKNGGDESPIVVRISRVGAAVRSLVLPDGADIVLGSDDTLPYLDGSLPYFGVVVGRVANRIAGASFPLPSPSGEQRILSLPANDNGRHCLHGGVVGWDKREWSVVEEGGEEKDGRDGKKSSVTLSLFSADGDQGFPGNVTAKVRYSLCAQSKSLRIEFSAVTDKPTAVAMTQHTYFNLDDVVVSPSPAPPRTILEHTLQIDASRYLPKNEATGIPDGRLESVDGCPYLDFRRPKKIGGGRGGTGTGTGNDGGRSDAEAGRGAFAGDRRGFDDCYAIDGFEKGPGNNVRRAAVLTSGTNAARSVQVWTDARGMQFYSAGFCGLPPRGPVEGKKGELHGPYAGAALETHAFPNGVNVEDDESWRRDMLLMPGEEYRHVVEWRFSW